MTSWAYLAIHDAACVAAGAYLVVNDSPWWAALCFLLAASTTVRETKEKS